MLNIFSVAVVFIRIIALFIFVSLLAAIPQVWAMLEQAATSAEGAVTYEIPTAIAIGAHLLLFLFLLLFAKQFARLLTRGLENTETQLNEPGYSSLQVVAFSVVGVYVLVYTIPDLLKLVVIQFFPAYSEPGTVSVPLEFLVKDVAQLVLGLWLVLGARGIVNGIRTFWATRISPQSVE